MIVVLFNNYHECAPPNMSDTGAVSKVIVGTCNFSGLDSVGVHGCVVKADDGDVVVSRGVIVLRVQD